MSAYFFKVSRETATGQMRVSPVTEAPKGLKPYAKRYLRSGLVETLRIFSTKREAETAYHDECFAAQLIEQPAEALFERMERDIDYLAAKYRMPVSSLSAIMGVKLRNYRYRVVPPIRAIARLARLRQMMDYTAKYIKET